MRPPLRSLWPCLMACLFAVVTGSAAFAADHTPTTPFRPHRPPHPPLTSRLPPPLLLGPPTSRLSRLYGGTPIDVTTYHYDSGRTGWNQTETDLTPASVASAKFGLLATLTVDGNVFAQPLLVSGFIMPNGAKHDVLIVATSHNSVYAFDARSYATLWQVNLGPSQNAADVGCDDMLPEYGITGTPVIVRASARKATIYLVAATEPAAGQFVATLHALSLGTGADVTTPSVIAPSATLSDGSSVGFDPQNQMIRAGLAYNRGNLYVGVGSHCDNAPNQITGWLLRYNAASLGLSSAFHTVNTPGGVELASIWMTGFAPAIDAGGNLYVATGNGDFTRGKKDWGESVIRLPPSLSNVTSFFTPSEYGTLNDNDEDLGSGGVMLLPPVAGQTAPPLAVTMGKESLLYLLNADSLGRETAGNTGPLQIRQAGGLGLWGGPAYYNGPAGPTVFTQTGIDVLRAWSVGVTTPPTLTAGVTGNSTGGYGGSLPIVSSNGGAAGTGVVWLIDRAANPFSIEAYDAVTLGAPIFTSQVGNWSNPDKGNPFLTPMVANGRVYAPGYLMVQVFGLQP